MKLTFLSTNYLKGVLEGHYTDYSTADATSVRMYVKKLQSGDYAGHSMNPLIF